MGGVDMSYGVGVVFCLLLFVGCWFLVVVSSFMFFCCRWFIGGVSLSIFWGIRVGFALGFYLEGYQFPWNISLWSATSKD